MSNPVHVMVAILRDRAGRVLISQRPAGKVQSGRWEFPGGKLESGEAPEPGLRRELLEELGIVAGPMQHLMELRHAYPGFSVRLDVREVGHFGGCPRGREGQELKWVSPEALRFEDILEADLPIIHALQLPDHYLVTPDPVGVAADVFLANLETALRNGINLVQFRAPSLVREEYVSLARNVLKLCREYEARLLLNGSPELLSDVDAHGVHLSSWRIAGLARRPVPRDIWLSVACHNLNQLRHAQRIEADMVLLSPVNATVSHPECAPMGWTGFSVLAHQANMPAYALGGLSEKDVMKARAAGGRGVAAIRGFWPTNETADV